MADFFGETIQDEEVSKHYVVYTAKKDPMVIAGNLIYYAKELDEIAQKETDARMISLKTDSINKGLDYSIKTMDEQTRDFVKQALHQCEESAKYTILKDGMPDDKVVSAMATYKACGVLNEMFNNCNEETIAPIDDCQQ